MTTLTVQPYSIFHENRPTRVAFFVNPSDKDSFARLEGIIRYNHDKWGGRYNPVILTDGLTISSEWWQFLKSFDPDVIKSYVPISVDLLKKIDNELSPFLIEDYDLRRPIPPLNIWMENEGLSVSPTPQSVASIRKWSLDKTELILFEVDDFEERPIRSFIEVNFGTSSKFRPPSPVIQNMPHTQSYAIKTKLDVANALSALDEYKAYVYQSDICTLPVSSISNDYDHTEELFTVIIGESLQDLIYYWNRIFSLRYSSQIGNNSIWLSKEMAGDPVIIGGLSKWIKRAADRDGSEHKAIRFVSYSLNQENLNLLAESVMDGSHLSKTVEVKEKVIPPKFKWDPNLIGIKERLHPVRSSGEEAYFSVQPPSVEEGVVGGQHWMVDVYIEYHPEKFEYITGRDYWWQLPNNNDLAKSMFNVTARICGNGIPAVQLQRDVPMISPYPNNKVNIKLLDEPSIFQILILGDKRPIYTADPRSNLIKPNPFTRVARSDKGRYLSGVIDLFGDLHNAYRFFENRYWRFMFDQLSHQNPEKDAQRKEEVLNRLKSEGWEKLKRDDGLEWLAGYILEQSKTQASAGKELKFKAFESLADKELAEYNINMKPEMVYQYDGSELKDELKDLIESEILATGFKTRCPSCGLSVWQHISEMEQIISCKGCGFEYGLEPELDWYYRLNSLVEVGVSRHYLVAVIIAFGHLLDKSKSSFIWRASLDLFDETSEKTLGDLDIVCIQDGKFVIGEVKNTSKGFGDKEFPKMESFALRIRPAKVVFSSLEEKPIPRVKKQIEQMAERLKSENIVVEWLPLSKLLFQPFPL